MRRGLTTLINPAITFRAMMMSQQRLIEISHVVAKKKE